MPDSVRGCRPSGALIQFRPGLGPGLLEKPDSFLSHTGQIASHPAVIANQLSRVRPSVFDVGVVHLSLVRFTARRAELSFECPFILLRQEAFL